MFSISGKRFMVLFLVVISLISVISVPSAHSWNTDADKAWWRSMPQRERNDRIIMRATTDNNKYVGLNCKEWVRRVVLDASRGVVNIPSTLPDSYGWYWDYSKYAIGISIPLYSAQAGWIVQMRWRFADGTWTPHTAIILALTQNGVYFIESNWCQNGCNSVKVRFVTYGEFYTRAYLHSVYYISGG